MPLVFSTDHWIHSQSATGLLSVDEQHFRREPYPKEKLKGAIFYADMDNKKMEKENLELLSNYSCWPPPKLLLSLQDRHQVLQECLKLGFVDHPVIQTTYSDSDFLPYPFVIKTGHQHRGLGKYLIQNRQDIPHWDGIASIEPFFSGESIRIFLVDNMGFGVHISNTNSWIKNSPGAEIQLFQPSPELLAHAFRVANNFKLEIAGVDYILNSNGSFHFLEINQFPGLDVDDTITPIIKTFFLNKMKQIEQTA